MTKRRRWRMAPTGIDWNYGDLDSGGSVSQSGRTFSAMVWDGHDDGSWSWNSLAVAKRAVERWLTSRTRGGTPR